MPHSHTHPVRKTLLFALAAGLLGGIISYVAFNTVSVQAQMPTVPPRSITAQSFILMNNKGKIGGTFSFDDEGKPVIQLFQNGRPTWSAGGKLVRPLQK